MWVDAERSLPFIPHCNRLALERLRKTFTEALPIAVIIGEGKFGPRQMISNFLDGIEADVVRIKEPHATAIDFMREVICAIDFAPKDLTLRDLENIFTMFLSYQRTHNRRTIVVIEETQDNSLWILDKVRRFVKLEMKRQNGLMVILSGRSNLNNLLNGPPLDQISIHAGQRINLAPFTLAETREYIRRRVESAGTADIAKLFEFEAITLIHEICAGVPDAVGRLCYKCLQLADEGGANPVTTDMVRTLGKQLRIASLIELRDAEAEFAAENEPARSGGLLTARINGHIIREFPIDNGHILIGRDNLCEIFISNSRVSRHHALVFNTKFGFKLVDLGSKNGTFVNERRINQYALKNNDVITVGNCLIEYNAGDDLNGWFHDIEATDEFEQHKDGPATLMRVHDRELRPPEQT